MTALFLYRHDELFLCRYRKCILHRQLLYMLSKFPHVLFLQAFVVNPQQICKSCSGHVCTHLFIDVSKRILIVLTYIHVCNTADIPKYR